MPPKEPLLNIPPNLLQEAIEDLDPVKNIKDLAAAAAEILAESNLSTSASLAGAIKGEWNAPLTFKGITIFAPCLAMPSASYFLQTIKPVKFCKNTKGMPRCEHNSIKCVPLRADSEYKIPLLAMLPTG